jgi:hypothetical protein
MEGEEPHGGTTEAPEAEVSISSPPAAPDTETGSAEAWCQEAVEAEKAVEEQWRREQEREKQQAREAAEPWQGLTLDCRPEKLEDANYAPSAAEGRGEGGVGIAIVHVQDGKIVVTGVQGGSRCAPSADNRCSAASSSACSHCAAVKANRGYIKDFMAVTLGIFPCSLKLSVRTKRALKSQITSCQFKGRQCKIKASPKCKPSSAELRALLCRCLSQDRAPFGAFLLKLRWT